MEEEAKANSFQALDIDVTSSIKNDQVQEYGHTTAHTIDHGRHMYYITWINQFFILFLGNMGFIILGGRGLKDVNAIFNDSPLRLQYHIIITGVAYFTFALIVPNMSSMRVWLGVSLVLTLSYIGFMLPVAVNDGKSNRSQSYEIEGSTTDKVFNALGAIATIVVCNTSGMLLEIQSTLRKPAVNNMRKALCIQYTAGLAVYYGVCIIGYWAYATSVSDYLPNNLTGPKWAKVVVNSGVYLQNIVSQNMFLQPVHEALDTKFLKLDKSINSRQNLQRRFVLRALLFTVTTFVAAALPFIGDFINFLGSFALIPLTFIFPSMIFLKVKRNTANTAQKAWHWAVIIFSSLLAVATTASAVRLIVNDVTRYHFFANT
ncbi:Proline transporter 1-like protein [Drosera capensis]